MYKKILKNSIICLSSSLALSWTTVATLSDINEISYAPIAAVNDSGNIAVVWTNGSYPDLSIQSSFYDGSTWSAFATISGSGTHVNCICSIDSAGNVIYAWETINGNNRYIYTAQKLINSSFETPILQSTSNYNCCVSLAINPNGQVILGWVDFNQSVKTKTYTFGGSWSSINTVSTNSDYKGSLKIGMDSLGNGILIWGNYVDNSIKASQTTGGFQSQWSTPATISSTGTNTLPSLSVDLGGNAVVAWTNIDDFSVSGALYLDSSWIADTLISNDYAAYPSVAASGTEFFVSWSDQSTGGTAAAIYTDSMWQTPFLLSSEPLNDYPQSSYSSGISFNIWADLNSGTVNVFEYPLDNSTPSPSVISEGDLNIYPYMITSSTNKTIAAWQLMIGSNYVIQVNTN